MKAPLFAPAALLAAMVVSLNLLDNQWLDGYRLTQATDEFYNEKGDATTKSFREIASDGLHKLNQSEGFQLARIRSIDEISQKAILRAWDTNRHHHPACLFQRRQHDNRTTTTTTTKTKKPFQAVILGGSVSSRPSDNCYVTGNQKPEEGRYSDILQHKLRQLGLKDATIHNRAQGSSTSLYSGMNIENLLDPSKEDIDLIIWEHSVNDFSNVFGGTADKMLGFFLSRLEHLYRVVQGNLKSPPPPVLVLYVWKANMGGYPAWRIRKGGIGYADNTFNNSLRVVDAYRDSGRLSVQVVKLSNIIDKQALIDNRNSFLDDNHHPACLANHLIADVLQYALFVDKNKNMNNNNKIDDEEHGIVDCENRDFTDAVETATNDLQLPDSTKKQEQLLDVLLDPRTTIRAISDWQPNARHDENDNNADNRGSYFPSLLTPDSQKRTKLFQAQYAEEKLVPGRKDRKISYRVPPCSNSNNNNNDDGSKSNHRLEFSFASNDWQWLCVVYKGTNIVANINNHGQIEVPLAGEGLSVSKLGSPMNDHVQKEKNFDWIDLRSRGGDYPQQELTSTTRNVTTTVSFCDNTAMETGESPVTTTATTDGSWIHLLFTVKA